MQRRSETRGTKCPGGFAAAAVCLAAMALGAGAGAAVEGPYRSLSKQKDWDTYTPYLLGTIYFADGDADRVDFYHYYQTREDDRIYVGHSSITPIVDGQWHVRTFYRRMSVGGEVRLEYTWFTAYRIDPATGAAEFGASALAEPPDCNNPQGCIAQVGDPINVINGHMISRHTDLYVPCPHLDLELRRTFSSGSEIGDGPLGPRWQTSLAWVLQETNIVFHTPEVALTNRCVQVRTGAGRVLTLVPEGTNRFWTSHHDVNATVTDTGSGYELRLPGQVLFSFDIDGVLTSIGEPWGNTLTLAS